MDRRLLLLAAAALVGCGGGIVPIGIESSDAGAAEASGKDGGREAGGRDRSSPPEDTSLVEDVSSPACPPSPPPVGASCSDSGQKCTYETSVAACNEILLCTGGAWTPQASSAPTCGTGKCPAAYPAATSMPGAETPCKGDIGRVCSYGAGQCECLASLSTHSVDGGPLAYWHCAKK